MNLLSTINTPADLRALPISQLPLLAQEIREYIIEVVSKNGGHIAPSLGVVDLTLALHYCYNTPDDKIIFDVGHQAYAHKIITGRREAFGTMRTFGGISGFPRTTESPYDPVSVGHASTSISAGLGLAMGRDLLQQRHAVVSVIGDGSLSGGLAFEGLNNLGSLSTNMTVVLNDNEMSISRNVGALSRYLTRLLTDRRFNRIKTDVWELLGHLSNVGKRVRSLVQSVDESLKHFVIPGKLFEDMGLRYFGPVDGHNIPELIEVFKFIRYSATGPNLVHVLTKKGKGYSFAEQNATKYHGIGSFSIETGDSCVSTPSSASYSEIFGKTLTTLGRQQGDIVAITAAMPDGTGLNFFRDEFPKRFFDVGIAESHAVTFAAGLALAGLKPVVAIYSTFLQRAFDQIIHDIALDRLRVVFCIDRAGLVGEDGPTHHGLFDLSYLRVVPNAVIMAPSSGVELRDMIYSAMTYQEGPVFIRYPRGHCEPFTGESAFSLIPLGQGLVLREGDDGVLIAAGEAVAWAQAAAALLAQQKISLTIVDARFVKPLDVPFYAALLARHTHCVTLESNSILGGFGSAICELAVEPSSQKKAKILRLGFPDCFVEQGPAAELKKHLNLDTASIARQIAEFLKRK
ncbi:MAG: 1-deoxy-D-xylulose-5-phosphate synthase [Chitinivibrionales bacterium]|nr:1-deoxy-D-xylulose-5-phosphate synthase [Chitinivibrionales bacterium]